MVVRRLHLRRGPRRAHVPRILGTPEHVERGRSARHQNEQVVPQDRENPPFQVSALREEVEILKPQVLHCVYVLHRRGEIQVFFRT